VFKAGSKIIPIVLLSVIGLAKSGYSQDLNYKDVFGNDWQNAMTFVKNNRSWIKPQLDKYSISYPLAIAVVFPELVRYSALRDKMETTLVKALYINIGEQYADFSIGAFQMKPSFAEIIREEASTVMGRKSKNLFKDKSEYDDIRLFRASIVNDMEDPKAQMNYLVAFFKICESRFKIKQKDENDRLRFLATVYNYGIDREPEQIENMTDKKFFNTKLFQTENYSYADVSLFWYKEYLAESLKVKEAPGEKGK
jgi:hypothetical protein